MTKDVVFKPSIPYNEKDNTPKTSVYSDVNNFLDLNKVGIRTVDTTNLLKHSFINSFTSSAGNLTNVVTVPNFKVWYVKFFDIRLAAYQCDITLTIDNNNFLLINQTSGGFFDFGIITLKAGDKITAVVTSLPSKVNIFYEEIDLSI